MTASLSFEQFLNVRSAFGATFDASGQRLYFLSTASGVPNLWSLRLDKERAWPDARPWPEPLVVGPERAQYAFASPRPGRVAFGLDQGGDERTQLHLLDGPGTRPRPLTAAPDVIHHFGDWHPDGRTICYAANARDPRYFDLYVRDVEHAEVRLVYEHDSTNRAIGFEPGGRRLLVARLHAPFEHELLLVDLADGSARSLTGGAPPGRYEAVQWAPGGRSIYAVTDREGDYLAPIAINLESAASTPLGLHPWDVDDLAISPDGRFLAYAVNVQGYSQVRIWHLGALTGARLDGPKEGLCYDAGRWTPTFNWSRDGRHLALTFTSATVAPDIWVADLYHARAQPPQRLGPERFPTYRARRVTHSWDADLPPKSLVQPELVQYPSFDGRQIPAFIFWPKDAPRDGSRPALFYVHGGPESQLRPSFNPIIQYFAHRGFVVVAPNVRGSTGYGKAASHLDDVERRLDAVRDLAAGAEWLAGRGQVHPRKIAVMGGSYGGYMVLAALTERPDLWAAGVDIVGIANFVTFLERTGPWRRHLREAEYGSLEHHRPLLERLSPLHRADRIAAPLFVVHGANDPRVPVSEAEQLVASLRARGRPVEYLRFEDEGHGLVKLDNRLLAYPRIADFLERHLLDS